MTKKTTTRAVAALILIVGLAVTSILEQSDPSASPAAAPRGNQTPGFKISWLRGNLTIAGHTRSRQHEQDLLQVASTSYPGIKVATAFEPLGTVPDYWRDMTIQVLYLLAKTVSAQAQMSVENLTIRGVTVDEPGWKNRLSALKKALPEGISVATETLVVYDTANIAAVCQHAFAAAKLGPINFAESSASFRRSAYPRLDRIIAIANACRDSIISITGHTDASGTDTWNQQLSLRRANAVGNYIVDGGIDRRRLRVSGVGSTLPIANNDTRYGRALNRRIEIILGGD
ncbi:MAG: OmpA family protein [Proteobacteria bacterium]|nr:OmpA family protein [Pseudomonadota bacterium]